MALSNVAASSDHEAPAGTMARAWERAATYRDEDPRSPNRTYSRKFFALSRAKVTEAVYEAVREDLPEAYENTPRGRFLGNFLNLVFSPCRLDKKTGGIIIPHEVIAQMAGVKIETEADYRNFRSGPRLEMLDAWQGRMQITLTEHRWKHGEARTAVVRLSGGVERARQAAVADCMNRPEGSPRQPCVYLDTGEPVSRRKKKQEREAVKTRREDACEAAPLDSMQGVLLSLLNGQLTERAQTIQAAIDQGVPALKLWYQGWILEPVPTHRDGETLDPECQRLYREYVGSFIESICQGDSPGWGYAGSEKTTRCHAFGPSAHTLPREGRKRLLKHLTTLDLKSSQLAIGSVLWGAPIVRNRLESCHRLGRSFWSELLTEAGLPPESKPAIKSVVYPCQFGMAEAGLQARLKGELLGAGYSSQEAATLANSFLASELMTDLLDARGKRLARIAREKGVSLPDWDWQGVTHEGQWVPLKAEEGHALSLLALEMQATEMVLMLGAAEVIANQKDITIVSWLHDGLTVAFRDVTKRKGLTQQIIHAVNERCLLHSIPTCLQNEDEG